jgi:hypothetical protein
MMKALAETGFTESPAIVDQELVSWNFLAIRREP